MQKNHQIGVIIISPYIFWTSYSLRRQKSPKFLGTDKFKQIILIFWTTILPFGFGFGFGFSLASVLVKTLVPYAHSSQQHDSVPIILHVYICAIILCVKISIFTPTLLTVVVSSLL